MFQNQSIITLAIPLFSLTVLFLLDMAMHKLHIHIHICFKLCGTENLQISTFSIFLVHFVVWTKMKIFRGIIFVNYLTSASACWKVVNIW